MTKIILLLILGLIGVAAIVVLALGARPVGGPSQQVEIAHGESRFVIAKELKDKGLIRSRATFLLLLIPGGGKVQAGTHTINPNYSIPLIVGELVTGKSRYVRITIPEGWRKEQIAAELTKKGFNGTDFLAVVKDKEGYLFPDTYFLQPDQTPQQIADEIAKNYAKRTNDIQPTKEEVILASIVEREAVTDEERPIIAGIYANRIKIGMALQADPTVQYAKDSNALESGKAPESYWGPITLEDYTRVVSPYNTYLNRGYPPTPIANPGLKSIQAAHAPAKTDAFFFFHTKDGKLITSKTHQEHTANKKQFL